MRVNVVGAGPAGLVFAIDLLRKTPKYEIVVHERSPTMQAGFGFSSNENLLKQLSKLDYDVNELKKSAVEIDGIYRKQRTDFERVSEETNYCFTRKSYLSGLERILNGLGVEIQYNSEVNPEELNPKELYVVASGKYSSFHSVFGEELGFREEKSKILTLWRMLNSDCKKFYTSPTDVEGHFVSTVHCPIPGDKAGILFESVLDFDEFSDKELLEGVEIPGASFSNERGRVRPYSITRMEKFAIENVYFIGESSSAGNPIDSNGIFRSQQTGLIASRHFASDLTPDERRDSFNSDMASFEQESYRYSRGVLSYCEDTHLQFGIQMQAMRRISERMQRLFGDPEDKK